MAALTFSQVNFRSGLLEIDGFPIECYRTQSGGSSGDTITITPNRIRGGIKAVYAGGPLTHDLPTTGLPVTTVTFTVRAPAGTVGSMDVWLVGFGG